MERQHMHENIGLKLDEDLERRIETFARQQGRTPADVVREAFREYEANHNGGHSQAAAVQSGETVYDRWNRAGLIGCINDPNLPSDLSTNPKYMEGFGRD